MRTVAPAVPYTPIFDWNPPRSRKVSLLSFLAASVVLHAFCFYIFQIIYPPTVALIPPPARVTIITPDSEEGRVLLRWIEAEDPALSSITQRYPESKDYALPKTPHVPSYVNRKPALKELPPYQPDLSIPSSQPPGPVPILRPSRPAVSLVSPTEVTFSSDAAPLGPPNFPPREFKNSTNEPPQVARFRVAINPLGEVRYCFLDESSGNPGLDEQARRYLLRVRFPSAKKTDSKIGDELLWATATFEWGNDLALPSPAPKTSAP